MLLTCSNVSYAYDSIPLFADITFGLGKDDRVALAGPNGCGKSTLLQLIDGTRAPVDGTIALRQGATVALVPQFAPAELLQQTVLDGLLGDPECRLEPHEVLRLLADLGFDSTDTDIPVAHLSPGWVTRLLIVRAMTREPDLLLLDEPTNHLDLAGIVQLESWMRERLHCGLVLVSHDRNLLDACTDRTVYFVDGRTRTYEKSFSLAREAVIEERLHTQRARDAGSVEVARLRASAKRLAIWGRTFDNAKLSRKAQSMQKRAEKLERALPVVPKEPGWQLGLSTSGQESQTVFRCGAFTLETPDGKRLCGITGLQVARGDRIAIIGPNGCGKSTLLRRMQAMFAAVGTPDADADDAWRHKDETLGVFDQNVKHHDLRAGLFGYLREMTGISEQKAHQSLAQTGFDKARMHHSIGELSGGELARLQFLIIKLTAPSVLMLDEPTNHLDVDALEELESQILDLQPSVLFVSHDRRFIANIATRFWLFENGRLIEMHDPERALDHAASIIADAPSSRGDVAPLPTTTPAEHPTSQEDLVAEIELLEERLHHAQRQKDKWRNHAEEADIAERLRGLYAQLEEMS